MALAKFRIPGGIQADRTDYSTGPFWKNGNRVRFQQGQPEPIGGFEIYPDFDTTYGTPSKSKPWRDLSDNDLMAVGTEQFLYLIKNGVSYDITPLRATSSNQNNCFTTTNESTSVSVLDSTHGAAIGDWISIAQAGAVGGITLSGLYQVVTVTDSNNYIITHNVAASSGATGGGANTDIQYLLPTGEPVPTAGLGFGADTWGASTWGTARTTTNITLDAALWSFAIWGEDLVACRRGGLLYHWDASSGEGTRSAVISGAPTTNLFVMASSPDRHIVSFGAHDGSSSDPMLIAWATQESLTTWAASATNTAGNQRLHIGDRLIAQVQTKEQTLVWTNQALFGMVFSGPPFIFTFRTLSTGSAPIGQNAAVDVDGVVYWISKDNFHVYNGRSQILPSPVRDFVFNDLNTSLSPIVHAGLNYKFTEIWWHYPSLAASATTDKYVTYNWTTNEWATGTLSRSTWNDAESWQTLPFAFNSSGTFFYHEKGTDANDAAINWSIDTGVIEVPEAGDDLFLIDRFITDFEQQTGNVNLTLYYRRYPNSTENSKTAVITPTTLKANKRIRGRQLRFGYNSTETNSFVKMGDLRGDWQLGGKR